MNHFIRKTYWGLADVFAFIASIFLGVWIMSPILYPANSWIVLNEITVLDAPKGSKIKMKINRELLRGTNYGRYEVEVRSYPQNILVCLAKRTVKYNNKAFIEIDKEMFLDWWAYSSDRQCVDWSPTVGQYYITTRHCWQGKWWAREACNPITKSNVFTITD